MWDDLHPSETDYAKMADLWFAALSEILPTADAGPDQIEIKFPKQGRKKTMEQGRFDAVLPLKFKDYKRFRILHASLIKFINDLRKLFIIVPDNEIELFRSKINQTMYQIIPETALVPELKFFKGYTGWYKQQLIKLAAAEIVDTDFYLILDADIICVRPTCFSDLVRDGRGFCFKHGLERSPEGDKKWYRLAARVLQIDNAVFYHHDVTPALLSKEAMLMLHKHLARASGNSRLSINKRNFLCWGNNILAKFIPRIQSLAEWRLYLLRCGEWTEYSLYYTFLESYDLFDKYHFLLDNRISGNSVWQPNDYNSWDPANSFLGDRAFYFSVIQSNTGIDPDEIWHKVRPFLQEE